MTVPCGIPVMAKGTAVLPTGPRFVPCCLAIAWGVYDVRADRLSNVCDRHVMPYFTIPAYADLVEYGLIRLILREEQ